MLTETFELRGEPRPDGRMYFTSPDLPGFRLLLEQRDEPSAYKDEIISALRQFYPLFKAAEAKRRTVRIVAPARSENRERADQEPVRLCASFALAPA